MKVTLEKQWCGNVAGSVVSVSEDRAWNMMAAGYAEPDEAFLAARKTAAEKMLEKAKPKKGKGKSS
jgi:hypothetical protein